MPQRTSRWLVPLILFLGLVAGVWAEAPGTIPAPYQQLYQEIDERLEEFRKSLPGSGGAGEVEITFAAELLPANGNRGPDLLTEKAYWGTLAYLDRLQALSVRGVKVAIPYPLPTPDFPRSQESLAFYQRMAEDLRRRQLKLLVGAGLLFNDPALSRIPISYSGLTQERLNQQRRQHVEAIIRHLRPDYVTIANEPSTERMLSGLSYRVEDFTGMVRSMLRGLDRSGVRVGAGAGTWNAEAYIRSLAEHTDLEYIDIHLYPINRDYLERAATFADLARAHRKRVVMGEVWVYKVGDRELGGPSATEAQVFGRDVFRFWEPLDQKLLQTAIELAEAKGIEFVSPFWSKYFFAYPDYSPSLERQPPGELLRMADQAAARNAALGQFSATGLRYKELIEGHAPGGPQRRRNRYLRDSRQPKCLPEGSRGRQVVTEVAPLSGPPAAGGPRLGPPQPGR